MKIQPVIYLAGCLILDRQGRIMLLHRDNGKLNQWETPGGKIDPGETPEQTAIRELKEELGVKVKLIGKAGEAKFAQADRRFHYTWFQAEVMSGTPTIKEPQTFRESRYFSWDEIIMTSASFSANVKNLALAHQTKQLYLQ